MRMLGAEGREEKALEMEVWEVISHSKAVMSDGEDDP